MRTILSMIAILSDIHGNLPALKAVIKDALDKGCNRFISLGDVVSYYSQPAECIDLLIKYDAINILGNHDSYVLNDTHCPRSEAVTMIINRHKKMLNKLQLEWLKKSPKLLQEEDILFLHGGPNNPQDQYLYSVSKDIFPDGINTLFSGHTHVQILAKFDNKKYCNPGSVGQPRDGDNRAAYATLMDGDVSLHRVSYDIDETVKAMKEAHYDSFYYENLYNGSQIGGRIDKVKIVK